MNKLIVAPLVLLTCLALTGCAEKPDWVEVKTQPQHVGDIALFYQTSSVRRTGENSAVVNVKWTESGITAVTAAARFKCKDRTFLLENLWSDSGNGKGLKPSVSSKKPGETEIRPTDAMATVMKVACE